MTWSSLASDPLQITAVSNEGLGEERLFDVDPFTIALNGGVISKMSS